MKLQLLSDLHLETCPDHQPLPLPDADLLVLAGDIGSYQAGSQLIDDDFGLTRFSPRHGPWQRVLYVPGNHEYDAREFDDTHARLREVCDRLGITWLEREVLVIDGVRFIGTTLWSDFDALASPLDGPAPPGGLPPHRHRAYRAANFYLQKYSFLRDGQITLADGVRDLALQCQAWLRAALAQPFDGPTVVVTHFAPSLRSADPRYGLTPGTAGFCNALDELLPHADLWLHGHLHCPIDYLAEGMHQGRRYRCRVVANPLGYARKGEQDGFRPGLIIEVPVPAAPARCEPSPRAADRDSR